MVERANPRSAALEMLKRIRNGTRFDTSLAVALPNLTPRDKRLAHEIAAGVLRHRRVIDREIQYLLARPDSKLSNDLQDVLRIGVYQLKHLDKVPSYAAVSSAVDLARDIGGAKAAGLVNAILRNFDRSGPTVDPAKCSTAERHSHPDWLVTRWQENFGLASTERLLEFFNTKPSLVVQAAQWDEGQLAEAFRAAGIRFKTELALPGIVVDDRAAGDLPGYTEGGFIVQDPAQRELLAHAAIPPDSVVWDACAAPGGKAVMLAKGRKVVATEVAPERAAALQDNRDRAAPALHIAVADATRFPFRAASFDAVLVDAPCSGTGSMARHPDGRWSLTPERIQRLAQLQRALLEATANAVKPGGLLVYLTCSLEPEENQQQVDWFLEHHSDFERTHTDLSIFPPDRGTDGGYGARLRKSA